MTPEPAEAWATARDMAALALDALDGPETPEALAEAIGCLTAALDALTTRHKAAAQAFWSQHMANLPTGRQYFGEVLE